MSRLLTSIILCSFCVISICSHANDDLLPKSESAIKATANAGNDPLNNVNTADDMTTEVSFTQDLFSDSEPVQLDALEDERGQGGFDIDSNAALEGLLSGNSAENTTNGNNIIDGNALNDANGVFSIIQNTGNNVLIQESTIITVTVNNE